MKKRYKIILITITLILSTLLINQMKYRNDELYAVNLKNKLDNDLVSILVSDGSDNYTKYEGDTFPSNTEYTYNSELSKCQDNNGNVIEGILSYNEQSGKVSIITKKTTYCYLYFDKKNAMPNPPKLAGGMIPVYYDESDTSWHKADETNVNEQYKWYDYDNKIWANTVTVTSINRSTYQSAAPGAKIADEDINTMFVWIPRYKYTVWNYNADGTVGTDPQEINVTFERGTNKSGEITCTDAITGTAGSVSETCKINNTTCTDATCNGKTYTHPAFTLGSDELTGFWVGKFELSTEDTLCYMYEKKDYCNVNTIELKIKPNVKSYRYADVSTLFGNIAKMKNAGNAYGFADSDDTHMVKNSEWGAVTYLYYSKYGACTNGTCTEMAVNSNSSYITGGNAYTANVNQTTTGNIYGVYDMSGGAWEFTMGNMVDSSGNFYPSLSGSFSPGEKYYDKYSYGTTYNVASARKRGKLGDATKEVFNSGDNNWNSDNGYFAANSTGPWFLRGGADSGGASAGAFDSSGHTGSGYGSGSTRVAIAIP